MVSKFDFEPWLMMAIAEAQALWKTGHSSHCSIISGRVKDLWSLKSGLRINKDLMHKKCHFCFLENHPHSFCLKFPCATNAVTRLAVSRKFDVLKAKT